MMTPEAEVAHILVADADSALCALLVEWLDEAGCRVVDEHPDVILVDVPLPRQGGAAHRVRELAARYPGTPVVALSSSFFSRVEANGAVARALGVDAVLPKPLTREALIGALRGLLPQLE
jgi:CheY-like chemotaxis protein